MCGRLYSSGLARLTFDDNGVARGRFLGGQISFMLARRELPLPLGGLPDLEAGEERAARLGADALDGASPTDTASARPSGSVCLSGPAFASAEARVLDAPRPGHIGTLVVRADVA